MIFSDEVNNNMGSRFFIAYTGSTPTVANLNTMASDIASSWATRLAPLTCEANSLTEIDILDIASDAGASGSWSGSHAGTDTSESWAAQAPANIEYLIARRYRGGKPRMFHPPPGTDYISNRVSWTAGYVTAMNTAIGEFFGDIAALSIGSMGALSHVNLSYYKGFVNVTNSSGRERAAPTYRTTALVDPITGYSTKVIMGSQRRRRTSTTP